MSEKGRQEIPSQRKRSEAGSRGRSDVISGAEDESSHEPRNAGSLRQLDKERDSSQEPPE